MVKLTKTNKQKIKKIPKKQRNKTKQNPKKSMGRDEETNTKKTRKKIPGSGTIEFLS
jgi:hypothetical protein